KLDPSFGNNGKTRTNFGGDDQGRAVALVGDGRIVVAGRTNVNGNYDIAVARYTSTGALDPTFDGDGKVITNFSGSNYDDAVSVAIQRDGKIVVAGSSNSAGSFDFAVARYDINGMLDPSFGTGGKVTTDFGSLSADAGFGLAITGDQKIVVAGTSNK